MKFSDDTLRTTSRSFEKALSKRGLKLPYQQSQNLWAQIAIGKNYSAAAAQAKSRGYIQAGIVSQKSICETLATAKRSVKANDAIEIFGEAIADELLTLSPNLSEICKWLHNNPTYVITSVLGERVTRLGLMNADHAGYIPVGTTNLFQLQDYEISWVRENSEFAAAIINWLAGRTENKYIDITLANMRASFDQEDQIFSAFMTDNEEVISEAISKEILRSIGSDNLSATEAHDYDQIRWAIYDVFERMINKVETTWLKPDCDLAEAVIDHIAGRIKQDLQLVADDILSEDLASNPEILLADTARYAMRRFIRK
jgi:hypothetical protein